MEYFEAKEKNRKDPLAEIQTEDGNFFKFSQIRRVREAYAVEYFEFFVFPSLVKNGEKYIVDRFQQATKNKSEKEIEKISALGIENFLKTCREERMMYT